MVLKFKTHAMRSKLETAKYIVNAARPYAEVAPALPAAIRDVSVDLVQGDILEMDWSVGLLRNRLL